MHEQAVNGLTHTCKPTALRAETGGSLGVADCQPTPKQKTIQIAYTRSHVLDIGYHLYTLKSKGKTVNECQKIVKKKKR